jgi:hypothetical protein
MAAKKFNLLPQKPVDNKLVIKNTANVKKAATIMSVVLVIALSISVGIIWFTNKNLNSLIAQNKDLKQKVIALENTETSLILVKDRLDKLQTLMEKRKSFDTFHLQADIVRALPEDVIYSRSDINLGSKADLQLKTSHSLLLADLIKDLESRDSLSSFKVNKISFDYQHGYIVDFEIQ